MIQTWSQFPRSRLTLLPEEQIDSLKQSNETRCRVVRHLTLVHASPVRKAGRLLPAHRRLPHQAFLSGLWWKLLSLQPFRLFACLPVLGCLRPAEQKDPTHFTDGFSAGSHTGAVIALAIRCLWPASQITARLGAIAMPKSGMAALVATAEPDRRNYYLVHAAEDCLCLSSPAATDATMADEEANEALSVHSSSSESPTIPSTEQPEEDDAHMEAGDSAATSSADEGDCLGNRPAPPAQDEMLAAEDEERSMLPPQGGPPR